MFSNIPAGRKRLQQQNLEDPRSFKGKKPLPLLPPPSLQSSPPSSSFRQLSNRSDTPDTEEFAPPPAESWHSAPTERYANASPSTFRPTPAFANSHYPHVVEAREDYYTRGSSPSSSLTQHINAMSISSERTLAQAHSPLVLYPDSRTGFLVSKSLTSGSFLSQSPPRTDHSPLVYPGFSSDMSSAGSVAGDTPPSIQSFSSESNSEKSGRHFSHQPGFVYPSSRSVGRPTPGGPKFRLKSKSNGKAKGSDNTPSIPAGLAGPSPGPSSVSAPSLKSPRPSISTSTPSLKPSGSTEPFVFPTTRSRAHPNSTPRKFRKRKDDSTEGNRNAKEFMGVPFKFRKKKTNAHFPPTLEVPSDDVAPPSPIAEFEYIPTPAQNIEPPVSLLPPKIGAYPLDPYDSALLENDKHTYTLLRRLNWTDTPSFCLWGHDPPSSVLDLGSGQGHWILEAAIYWKGYGTRFTALDIADTMKFLRPLALKNGVADSIKFVRSNFLKQPLPFDDESFDLVRMSNLTYAISYDKWNFILGEVCRVLTVGGRLEFIDDHIFFPYGKDLRTPSASASQTMNGQRHADRPPSIQQNDADSAYRFSTDNEGEASHVLNGNSVGSPPGQYVAPGALDIESQFWNEQVNASQELESVFEDMMKYKFGIHLCPSQFISEMLTQIFGYSRKVKTIHLTVAPSHPQQASGTDTPPVDSKGSPAPADQPNANRFASTSRDADVSHASAEICGDLFENSPGLVIWPSTLVPMPLSELQMHALKHPRTLLSCKAGLAEFAKETLDVNPEDDVVQEALWEYESSFATRFNPPPQRAEGVNIPSSTSPIADNRSSLSVTSISSETRSALWDYDSELRTYLASPAGTSFVNETRSTNNSSPQLVPSAPQSHEAAGIQRENTSISSETDSTASDLPSFSSRPPFVAQGQERESIAPPDYCATEPIHVRTFHIYEAIKMEQGLVSSN